MKNIVCALIFLLIANNGYTQVNPDSLKLIWTNNTLSDSLRFKAINSYYLNHTHSQHPDSVVVLINYHFRLAKEKNSKREMANALNEKAFAYYIYGETDSSLAMLEKAVKFRTEMKDSLEVALLNNNIGNIYRGQNDYQKAVRYYTYSLATFEKKEKYIAQADALNNIGLIYEDIELDSLALEYLNRAMKLYEQEGMEERNGNIWLNIGAIYLKLGNNEEAKKYLKKAYRVLKSVNNRWSLSDYYHQMALLYESMGIIDTASNYIKKSLEINKELGNNHKINLNLIMQANLILPANIDEAIMLKERIIKSSQTTTDNQLKSDLFKLLYRVYKKHEKYDLALEMYEKHMMYYDSVLIEKNNIALVRQAIKSEYDLKLFNNQLENDKKQAQLKLKQLKDSYLLIFIGSVIIMVIIVLTRYRINNYRKQKKVLLKEIDKLKTTHISSISNNDGGFNLDRSRIEKHINREINETDWKVLNILLDDPVITNKEIAEKAFMSVDGIGSSLRRMYDYFDIKESKYKKISLILDAIKKSDISK